MQKIGIFLILLFGQSLYAQDSTMSTQPPPESKVKKPEPDYIHAFSSPKLINANTVELIPKHVLQFMVIHNFGDIGGSGGGAKNFFGLDNAADVRIGFQYGLSKKLNLIATRAKGAGPLQQLYELGIKYQILQQANDGRHPLTIAFFANSVLSAMKASEFPDQENYFKSTSDRASQTFQVMLAKKLGKISVQLNPTVVNRGYVIPGDDKTLFALGGALRVPVAGKFSLIFDYTHTFRSQRSTDLFKSQDIRFYDALGIGIEILTAGHVFHMNFTNATETLENRFIPRTVTSWTKGQFRWGFTIARDFNLFWKKDHR